MSAPQPYYSEPPLKVCEWSVDQGGGAYIAFEEYVDIPGLEKAAIRIEFKQGNSLQEIEDLVRILKKKGFRFVVQK